MSLFSFLSFLHVKFVERDRSLIVFFFCQIRIKNGFCVL